MRLTEQDEKDLRACAIDRALEGDHIARWKLAEMLAAYQTDPMMDAVDLKVQLELWAEEHAQVALLKVMS